jgi:hypothetical protein
VPLQLRKESIKGRTKVKERKKQDKKCVDRREKERGQWKKGWAKN